MPEVSDYESQMRNENIPKLGNLIWYSVSGVKVKPSDLKEMAKDTFLDGTVPAEPKDADVFRRICSNAERKKVETGDPKLFKNVLVRTASGPTEDHIVRRIVIETVTPENKRLDYFQTMDVEFNRKTSKVEINVKVFDPIAEETAQHIKAEFESWKGHLNSYAVREWIRGAITKMHATHVKPTGGIYFVSEEHEPSLKELEELVDKLGSSSVHYLPLVDTDKQREMLKAAFESESVGEIDELLAEIGSILGNPDKQITEKAYNKMMERFDNLGDKLEDYESLLKGGLSGVSTRLSIFETQLRRLQPRIKKPKTKENKKEETDG